MSKNERPFKRQFFGGYKRKAVDEHLAVVDASIADLREAVEKASEPAHQELVLRATRLAVEDVLQRAHDDAVRIRSEAETEASRLLADAYDIVAAREAVIDLRPEATDEPEVDERLEDAVTDLTDAAAALDTTPAVDPDWNADLAKAIED